MKEQETNCFILIKSALIAIDSVGVFPKAEKFEEHAGRLRPNTRFPN